MATDYSGFSSEELQMLLVANEASRSRLQTVNVDLTSKLNLVNPLPYTDDTHALPALSILAPVCTTPTSPRFNRSGFDDGDVWEETNNHGLWALTAMFVGADMFTFRSNEDMSVHTGLDVPEPRTDYQFVNANGCGMQQYKDRVGFHIDSTLIAPKTRRDGGQVLELSYASPGGDVWNVVSPEGELFMDFTVDVKHWQCTGDAVAQLSVWGFFRNKFNGHVISFVYCIADNRYETVEPYGSTDTNWYFFSGGWSKNAVLTPVLGSATSKADPSGNKRYKAVITPENFAAALKLCKNFCEATNGQYGACDLLDLDPKNWALSFFGISLEYVNVNAETNSQVKVGFNVRDFKVGYLSNRTE